MRLDSEEILHLVHLRHHRSNHCACKFPKSTARNIQSSPHSPLIGGFAKRPRLVKAPSRQPVQTCWGNDTRSWGLSHQGVSQFQSGTAQVIWPSCSWGAFIAQLIVRSFRAPQLPPWQVSEILAPVVRPAYGHATSPIVMWPTQSP